MNAFTLRQLEYFVAVADEGSISAAAKRLHVSPGGISVALSDLERSLRVQLTLRHRSKGVALTAAGVTAAEKARAVLRESVELSDLTRVMRGELVGQLRVGCFTTLSPWLLPRIVAHFAREHPAVDLRIVEGSSDMLQDRLRTGEIDACLLYAWHVRTSIDMVEIAPAHLQLVLSPDHRLARLDEVPLRELQGEPAALLTLRPARDLVENVLRGAGFEPDVRWRSTNVETIRGLVARGLAYTLMMGRPAGDMTYDGLSVVYRQIADPQPENSVILAVPRGAGRTARVDELTRFCRESLATERQIETRA